MFKDFFLFPQVKYILALFFTGGVGPGSYYAGKFDPLQLIPIFGNHYSAVVSLSQPRFFYAITGNWKKYIYYKPELCQVITVCSYAILYTPCGIKVGYFWDIFQVQYIGYQQNCVILFFLPHSRTAIPMAILLLSTQASFSQSPLLYLTLVMCLMKTLLSMRFKALVVIALLLGTKLFAQTNVAPLLDQLKHARTDTALTNAYRDIFRYYQYADPDSAIYYLEQGLQEVNQRKYKAGIATLTSLLAAEDLAQGRVGLARRRNREALKIFTEIDNKDGIAFVNNSLGTIEGKSGNFDEATKYFMSALKLYESTSNPKGIQACYIKLGVVNEQTQNPDKAIDYYNKAMEMAKENADTLAMGTLFNNIGIVYGKRGDFKNAMACFERAIQLCNSPQMDAVLLQSYMDIGIVYDNLEMNREALEYLNKAMVLAKTKNFPEDYARISQNMASIYEKTDPAKAMSLLKDALDTTNKIGQKYLELDIIDAMIATAKTTKDYKTALSLTERSQALRDTLFNIAKAKEIADLQSTYELDKSNEKVQQLTLSEKRNAQKRDIIITVAAGLALTLLALMFFYRKSQRLNVQLLKRESELRKANTIKDKLFSIIGHDLRGPVANAPHMIDIYRHPGTTAEEKQYLLEALLENANASLDTLDKLLYWGQSQIKGIGMKRSTFNASGNVDNIMHLMNSSAERKQISIVNNLPADTTIYADPTHFDFVIRNLLSNAIKFTNASGTIKIAADKSGKPGFVVFSVADNGVGMDAIQLARVFEPLVGSTLGTANERGTSIGLMLCREFVKENGGEIWVESQKDKGSVFYFSLLASA